MDEFTEESECFDCRWATPYQPQAQFCKRCLLREFKVRLHYAKLYEPDPSSRVHLTRFYETEIAKLEAEIGQS